MTSAVAPAARIAGIEIESVIVNNFPRGKERKYSRNLQYVYVSGESRLCMVCECGTNGFPHEKLKTTVATG